MDGWVFLCLLPVPTGNSFTLGLTWVHSYEGNVVPRTKLLTKHTLAGLGVFFYTWEKKMQGKQGERRQQELPLALPAFLVQRGSSGLFPLGRINGL